MMLNQNFSYKLKRMAEFFWYSRSYVPILDFPIPCRLPYDGWFLAYGDAIGARIFGYVLSGHPYEEGQLCFVSHFLREGMTFFDIGANQGFYTILASKRVSPTGKVFAFEPSQREFKKLVNNLKLNHCHGKVVKEEKALGNRKGLTDFYMCLDYQGSFSSICKPAADVTSRKRIIKVPITTLDSYIENNRISSIDLIKIDTEGAEMEVLKGGARTIETLRPIIMCEIEDRRSSQWGYDACLILDFLERYGYKWFLVKRDGTLRLFEGGRKEINANLVSVPNEKTEVIETILGKNVNNFCVS